MSPICNYCKKTFTSRAALNFHIRKAHQNDRVAPASSSSDNNAEPNLRRSARCRMLKFSKLQEDPDPSSGPFKLLDDPRNKKRVSSKTTEEKKPKVPSPPSVVPKCEPKAKDSSSSDNSDVEIPEVSNPRPSTSTSSHKLKTPTSSFEVKKKKRIKRTKLSKEFIVDRNSSASDDEGNEKSKDMPSGLISSFEEAPNTSRNSNSFSTPGESAASSVGSQGTSSGVGRGRPPKGSNRVKGEIPSCPVCKKGGFRNYNRYIVHLEIHEGKRPFVCPYIDCGSAYATDLELLEHVSIKHSKEAAFDCDRCGSSYKTRVALRRHKCKK